MFNAMLLFWLQASSVCPAYQISSLWYFPPSFFARFWIHPSVSSLLRFSNMWEKKLYFWIYWQQVQASVGIGVLFPLIYAFFPAVYSTAAIPISILVRLGLVAMFVAKKQLWENWDFTEPACQMKIRVLFLLSSSSLLETSIYRRSTGTGQNLCNFKWQMIWVIHPPISSIALIQNICPYSVCRWYWKPFSAMAWRNFDYNEETDFPF